MLVVLLVVTQEYLDIYKKLIGRYELVIRIGLQLLLHLLSP